MPSTSCATRFCWLTFVTLFAALTACPALSAQEITPKEQRLIDRISQGIERAGAAYLAKRYRPSATVIEKAIEDLESLLEDPRAELIDAIRTDHARLQKAHQLLTAAGEELPNVPELPEAAGQPDGTMSGEVSFKDGVAPILLAKCGNCHVQRNRGDFSTASYSALMDSTMVASGKPDDSRLIEVIVNGEMPKGGLKVEPKELETLKNWIQQGAKFDGSDRTQNLAMLAGQPAGNTPMRGRVEVKSPTGKETVSFGLDVAPVLVANCGECHMTRNPRGNFNMTSFQSFLRGGDGGAPVIPGDANASPLIQRLRGDNGIQVMPPFGKLDDDTISKISTWVNEGASFDGGDAQLALTAVAARAKANSLSHEALVAERKELAQQTWKLAMSGVESQSVTGDSLLLTGPAQDDRLEAVAEQGDAIAAKIKSELKLEKQQPLVKGNILLFVVNKRYDFGEFGRMVEKRDFPDQLAANWNFDTINAYSVLLMTRNQEADDVQAVLTQQMTALHFASQTPDLPRWFADGVGWWMAKRLHSRDDSLSDLDTRAEAALAQMQRPDDFVQNRLPDDQAALVAYVFIKQLKAAPGNRYNTLMRSLKSGESFDVAFRQAFGVSPAEMLNQQANQGNRRNRRQ